jgi:hypothetical protein
MWTTKFFFIQSLSLEGEGVPRGIVSRGGGASSGPCITITMTAPPPGLFKERERSIIIRKLTRPAHCRLFCVRGNAPGKKKAAGWPPRRRRTITMDGADDRILAVVSFFPAAPERETG